MLRFTFRLHFNRGIFVKLLRSFVSYILLFSFTQFGAAQSPYYPQVGVEAANGYQRTIIELPAMAGRLEQWQSQPLVQATYVLLDFGRRRSAAEAARNYLIASDFAFNRAIQQVVFSTQSAYYSLDTGKVEVLAGAPA